MLQKAGLAAPGWGANQKVPPLRERFLDGTPDLSLRQARFGMRKGEETRGLAKLFEARDPYQRNKDGLTVASLLDEGIEKKLGPTFGDPMIMGFFIGIILGLIAYFVLGWYTASLLGTAVSFAVMSAATRLAPARFEWKRLNPVRSKALEAA